MELHQQPALQLNRRLALARDGCAFIVADGEPCGATRKLASSYCPAHHALCYLATGSRAEQRRLRLIETLADAVGRRLQRRAFAQAIPKGH